MIQEIIARRVPGEISCLLGDCLPILSSFKIISTFEKAAVSCYKFGGYGKPPYLIAIFNTGGYGKLPY